MTDWQQMNQFYLEYSWVMECWRDMMLLNAPKINTKSILKVINQAAFTLTVILV